MRLHEVGEFGFIDRLAQRVVAHHGVRLGIGDDCAVTDAPVSGRTLTTTDLLVEGVHFDLAYTDPAALGHKSLAVNLSDIAAMGGVPRHVLLGLAIPPSMEVEFLDAFMAAFLDLADQYAVTLIGGDTCASLTGLMVSVTLVGEQSPDRILTRGAAKPGDLVVVSGTVGDAAIGLELLQGRLLADEGDADAARFCINRHLRPTPRVALGQLLTNAGIVGAMIDLSDGIMADLGHVLTASQVGARLAAAKLPISPAYRTLAARLPGNFWELALTGGEDYELLFTVPAEREADLRRIQANAEVPLSIIGAITGEAGLQVLDGTGAALQFPRCGYNHFA